MPDRSPVLTRPNPSLELRGITHMEHTYPTGVELAETIRRALAAAKLSQRELAEAAGIAPSTLNRRLAGDPLTWDELRQISRVLGRSASSIIAETEVRSEASRIAA